MKQNIITFPKDLLQDCCIRFHHHLPNRLLTECMPSQGRRFVLVLGQEQQWTTIPWHHSFPWSLLCLFSICFMNKDEKLMSSICVNGKGQSPVVDEEHLSDTHSFMTWIQSTSSPEETGDSRNQWVVCHFFVAYIKMFPIKFFIESH